MVNNKRNILLVAVKILLELIRFEMLDKQNNNQIQKSFSIRGNSKIEPCVWQFFVYSISFQFYMFWYSLMNWFSPSIQNVYEGVQIIYNWGIPWNETIEAWSVKREYCFCMQNICWLESLCTTFYDLCFMMYFIYWRKFLFDE